MIAIQRILVPTDFSEMAADALEYAKGLADVHHAALYVHYVLENPLVGFKGGDPVCPIPAVRKEMEREAEEYMAKVLSPEERQKYRATMDWRWGTPGTEIVNYAKECRADLIVIGTHGRGVVSNVLLGGVATQVVRSAPCPVLVVRHPHQHETSPNT